MSYIIANKAVKKDVGIKKFTRMAEVYELIILKACQSLSQKWCVYIYIYKLNCLTDHYLSFISYEWLISLGTAVQTFYLGVVRYGLQKAGLQQASFSPSISGRRLCYFLFVSVFM